jgi:hypothetical protein
VSIVAEDLFELEHLAGAIVFEKDHLYGAVSVHGCQCRAKFANGHRGVLTNIKDLLG